MAKEIERKFLVTDDSFISEATAARHIVQAYISTDPRAIVRVRIKDSEAFLTVKGLTEGCTRDEWEYPIPADEARQMIDRVTSGTVIAKTRYIVESGGRIWEVDRFEGDLEGLTVAEVELPSEDTPLSLPSWAGREVTGDPRYYNSSLAVRNDGSV